MKSSKKYSNEHTPETAVYDVKTLGLAKTIILGLQHAFAMFGATVMVPMLTGLSVTTTLFMAGVGTLLFHLFTKGKVPAFLGSSFAFLGGYAAVAPMINESTPNTEMLPYACGGVFVAGFLYVVFSLLIQFFGTNRIMRIFPPVVTGPIIICIGLILIPSAINNSKTNWVLSLTALAIIVVCNIWGRGMVKITPIIISVISTYILALCMGIVDFSSITYTKMISLPLTSDAFAKFDLSAIITIVPIALATMMEHIGDISAIGATTGINYIKEPGLHRTLLGDGLATSLSALFGGPANTTYGENTGVLALTKVYDPVVMRIAACFAIILSFFPIIGSFISSIPVAIIGGVSLVLYIMISAIGVRNLVEQKVDFKKIRNIVIIVVILASALGINHIGGITFTINSVSINLSGLAIASILGIILNIILPGNDYAFEVSTAE